MVGASTVVLLLSGLGVAAQVCMTRAIGFFAHWAPSGRLPRSYTTLTSEALISEQLPTVTAPQSQAHAHESLMTAPATLLAAGSPAHGTSPLAGVSSTGNCC